MICDNIVSYWEQSGSLSSKPLLSSVLTSSSSHFSLTSWLFPQKKSDWERESGKGKQYIGKSAYQNKAGSWKKEENVPNAKIKKGKNISKNKMVIKTQILNSESEWCTRCWRSSGWWCVAQVCCRFDPRGCSWMNHFSSSCRKRGGCWRIAGWIWTSVRHAWKKPSWQKPKRRWDQISTVLLLP